MNKVKGLKTKDLLGLRYLTAEDINLILDTAQSMKEVMTRPVRKVPALLGKNIVTLFYEPSTRTRTSFDVAAKNLSANTTNIALAQSSVKKGETLIDTAKNLEVMGYDGVIIRHKMSGAPHLLAKNIKGAVINAGDGCNEHPTQGLLDIFTMREKRGDIAGKRVVIVGDIAHSRVARSNIWGLNKLGAKVVVVGPPTLIPKNIEELGCEVSYKLEKVIEDADFINVLRIQLERQEEGLFPSVEEYHKFYGITADRLKKCKSDIVVLHPGPINRGVEITSEVADGPYNVILEQVTNGVAVRMAVLFLLLSGRKPMLMKKN
ncbi:aspartate carbamoyltransferase [candidate division WOR-1 bacterium RIFOXYA2_FULL_36_21]|uniref:Aspartate carbamoyltransferase n=1 Tax=candidate division WOR-1 bacterium RIFOXYB2_FULL_36_35 TaxID=1802578 RepID=A0A1F4S332_UNCSA|nr:MAG: aspartate carbamoyltransferase [candidate division WOR-1 bacterium RIFOXYA2_FULL_36_21]OGC14854.1 MAG: aspartate carbamoyltransferase [candidate division WOR-1 bacterium RIFOXYB2_FULL_36_35]OGC15606.1 MAG: aspartate carbamoyltransferase [candidate division WOR-1 bacterium RIFOXYA12_FULL_36_13]